MGFLNDKQKELLTEFVKFVKKELEIEKAPKVMVQNGRQDLKLPHTTIMPPILNLFV